MIEFKKTHNETIRDTIDDLLDEFENELIKLGEMINAGESKDNLVDFIDELRSALR